MSNRMPDENTNPVGTTQTSQNDQATTSQTGNDFTLDFGGGEDKNEVVSGGVELNLNETNDERESGDLEHDMNLGFSDDAQEGETQENNISIQDLDSILNENKDEEFDISLNDTKQDESERKENLVEEEIENSPNTVNEENKVENEQQEKDETEQEIDDNSTTIDGENTVEDQTLEEENDSEEAYNGELSDTNSDYEESTENKLEESNSEDGQEIVEDSVEAENISQGDNLGASLEDSTEVDEGSNTNSNDEILTDELNDTENEMAEGEEPEKLEEENPITESDQIIEEEVVNNTQDTEEINPDTEPTEIDLSGLSSSQQEKSSESEEVKTAEDDTNITEISTENENTTDSAETTNDENIQQEPTTENLIINNEIKDNSEEDGIQTKSDEDLQKQDNNQENFIMNFNLDDDDTESQQVKQPEIEDLTGDAPVDSPLEMTADENNEGKNENNSIDVGEENSIAKKSDDISEIDSKQELNQDEKLENDKESNNTDNQDFVLDYVDSEENKEENQNNNNIEESLRNNPKNMGNESELSQTSETPEEESTYKSDSLTSSTDDKTQESLAEDTNTENSEQDSLQTQVDQINNINESIVSENVEENSNNNDLQQTAIATLSLDQILDSELNSNPQYADNSKAVPKNVPLNSGFFNKKTVGIMAVVLILGGVLAALAFPSKKTEKDKETIEQYTGTQLEEGHYAGDEFSEGEEYTEIETTETTEMEVTTDMKHANPKVDEFPDRNPGEDDIEEPTVGDDEEEEYPQTTPPKNEPIPYNCTDDNCMDEPEVSEATITTDDIEETILNFKSTAEKYYAYGDENQDKKLIKYTLQIINLCDTYKLQVENGEENTQESFEEFKSKIKGIESKIEKYIGGGDEIETFTQNNYKEEYDFTGKNELLDFIKNGDNY